MDARYRTRPAERTDLGAVVRLERLVFGDDAWSRDAFRPHLGPVSRVVVEDGRIVGYIVARVVGGEEAEILNLAVDPAHRRRGVGRILVDSVVAHCRRGGVRRIFLEVRVSNASAAALYASAGFVTVARRRGYYRHPPEDALVMCCDLGHVSCSQ